MRSRKISSDLVGMNQREIELSKVDRNAFGYNYWGDKEVSK